MYFIKYISAFTSHIKQVTSESAYWGQARGKSYKYYITCWVQGTLQTAKDTSQLKPSEVDRKFLASDRRNNLAAISSRQTGTDFDVQSIINWQSNQNITPQIRWMRQRRWRTGKRQNYFFQEESGRFIFQRKASNSCALFHKWFYLCYNFFHQRIKVIRTWLKAQSTKRSSF